MRNTGKKLWILLGLATLASHVQAAGQLLSDPTRPYDSEWYTQNKPQTGNTYNLESTLVSSARRVAVINGIQVTEGDTLGNATVVRIGKYEVTLQSPNRQINLKLLPNVVRKQP